MRFQTPLLLTVLLSSLLLLLPAAPATHETFNGGWSCRFDVEPPTLTERHYYCLTVKTVPDCWSADPTCQTIYIQLQRSYVTPVLADGDVDAQDAFALPPQIWLESNRYRGLQETICSCGSGPLPPDTRLLP